MTVCVAVIAETNMVLGASDRMLSTVDIAFEPRTRKIREMTSAIFAMTSGDSALNTEVLNAVRAEVDDLISQSPEWLSVAQVANLYVKHWCAIRLARAEAAYLFPLGLTVERFLKEQSLLNSSVAERLTNSLIGHLVPSTSCIITGVDNSGAHIFVADNGVLRCEDGVGFAAIGSGGRHAGSQLMMTRYDVARSATEALVLVHMAKKRAEVSPTVGSATDLFMIGPALGQRIYFDNNLIGQLDAGFRRLVRSEGRAAGRTVARFETHLRKLTEESVSVEQDAQL